MATQTEQVKFIFDTKDNTSKNLKKIVAGFLSMGAALAVVRKAGEFIFESTKLAARVETLGVVTETLGKNAGYTATEITQLERAIQKQGITTKASREALALMMQAQLDVADSADLARLAQDAAVVAGTNSSEAFKRLVQVISSGNVRMARTMGLQVDFNKGYKEMAESIGKTTEELTAQEKAQSRANTVMGEGEQIAGAYEAAMDTVGKQLESTARYWEEYKVAVGKANVGLLGFINTGVQEELQYMTAKLQAQDALNSVVREGILTEEEAIEIRGAFIDTGEHWEEVLKKITPLLDAEKLRVEELVAIEQMHNETKAEKIGLMEIGIAQVGTLGAAWDGLVEKELRVLQVEAILAGDYALATNIGKKILAIENQEAALEDLIKLLDELDGKTIDYKVVASIQTYGGGAPVKGSPGEGGKGYASGGSFTVPSGYPNDSYPMRVESGEHVSVTPSGQDPNAGVIAAINELKDEMYTINQELVQANS